MTSSNVVEAGINAHQNLHRAFNAVRSGQTDQLATACGHMCRSMSARRRPFGRKMSDADMSQIAARFF